VRGGRAAFHRRSDFVRVMLDNVKSKLVLIFVVLAIAGTFLALGRVRPDLGIQFGLDLSGGSRFVYRLEFDEAQVQGEDQAQLLRQTIEILRDRIDPDGVIEPVIRPEGVDRIVIEIPGVEDLAGAAATATLFEELPAEGEKALEISLALDMAGTFPAAGGEVAVGGETIRYSEALSYVVGTDIAPGPDGIVPDRKMGVRLLVAQDGRGYGGSTRASHPAGTQVRLVSTNYIQNKIENLGQLSFEIVATDASLTGSGTDLASEQAKLDAWFAANPQATNLRAFNALSSVPDAGQLAGPSPWIRWAPDKKRRDESGQVVDTRTLAQRARPLLRLENHPDYQDRDWRFDGAKLKQAFPTRDQRGLPAIGFEWDSRYASAFGAFTENFSGYEMAIVLNEQIESAPSLDEPIFASGIIRSGSVPYRPEEVEEMVTVLRTGSLRVRPVLESKERVEATLGASYVQRGWISGLTGILGVFVFMAWYYRRLGVFSIVSLLANMFVTLGAMSFLNATLTLPGIAGLVLTIGMAVDANILIFDRVREEMDNGRNIKQATKNGFEKAMSAIIDSNLTTLITSLVLYNIGTGPVKGFAVTLSIGIVASMFGALVVTRVLMHYTLARGTSAFPMGSWLATANYNWLGTRKAAIAGSIVVLGAGLGLFGYKVATDPNHIIGIDFLGGAEAQVRMEQPTTREALEAKLDAAGGSLARADVTSVLSSRAGDGYTEFRLVTKAAGATKEEREETGRAFVATLKEKLADVLQKGPLDIDAIGADGSVTMRAYFQAPHPAEEIAAAITSSGMISDVVVEGDAVRPKVYSVRGKVPVGTSTAALALAIEDALPARDSLGQDFELASAIANESVVGSTVSDELADKALLAMIISLFAIVMYIRVRFAEYSYGFAAVIALVHDVLFTLGAVTVANMTGLVDIELDLTMIAAFLTIIGYSLNDTIVIFDRVRENRPRMEGGLEHVLNVSINQTLSRTILTTLTTFIAVGTLYFANMGTGNALESFAFTMLMGMITGTYSTIYIANPALLWLENRAEARRSRESAASEHRPAEASA
jgi:SecD/SecF fusion protein